MTALDDRQRDDLILAARTAARNAYAPYSRFAVGAALLLNDGGVVTGTNFENVSYGLSLCAETVALATANSQGRFADVVAIAVAGGPIDADPPRPDPVRPCGRCRQILAESAGLSGRDLIVYCTGMTGDAERHRLSDLLPHAFAPDQLG